MTKIVDPRGRFVSAARSLVGTARSLVGGAGSRVSAAGSLVGTARSLVGGAGSRVSAAGSLVGTARSLVGTARTLVGTARSRGRALVLSGAMLGATVGVGLGAVAPAGALVAVSVVAAGCAGTTHPAVRTRADAAIEVDCPVDDARVYVDEHFVGRARELRGKSIGVVAGAQRIEVRADGWFTAYREVPVAKDGRARVEVPLRRVPEGETGE